MLSSIPSDPPNSLIPITSLPGNVITMDYDALTKKLYSFIDDSSIRCFYNNVLSIFPDTALFFRDVNAIKIFNDILYVSGKFTYTTLDGIIIKYLGAYNTITQKWTSITGINGFVNDILLDKVNGLLYIAGNFNYNSITTWCVVYNIANATITPCNRVTTQISKLVLGDTNEIYMLGYKNNIIYKYNTTTQEFINYQTNRITSIGGKAGSLNCIAYDSINSRVYVGGQCKFDNNLTSILYLNLLNNTWVSSPNFNLYGYNNIIDNMLFQPISQTLYISSQVKFSIDGINACTVATFKNGIWLSLNGTSVPNTIRAIALVNNCAFIGENNNILMHVQQLEFIVNNKTVQLPYPYKPVTSYVIDNVSGSPMSY
jgi:hypothetical protein